MSINKQIIINTFAIFDGQKDRLAGLEYKISEDAYLSIDMWLSTLFSTVKIVLELFLC